MSEFTNAVVNAAHDYALRSRHSWNPEMMTQHSPLISDKQAWLIWSAVSAGALSVRVMRTWNNPDRGNNSDIVPRQSFSLEERLSQIRDQLLDLKTQAEGQLAELLERCYDIGGRAELMAD